MKSKTKFELVEAYIMASKITKTSVSYAFTNIFTFGGAMIYETLSGYLHLLVGRNTLHSMENSLLHALWFFLNKLGIYIIIFSVIGQELYQSFYETVIFDTPENNGRYRLKRSLDDVRSIELESTLTFTIL